MPDEEEDKEGRELNTVPESNSDNGWGNKGKGKLEDGEDVKWDGWGKGSIWVVRDVLEHVEVLWVTEHVISVGISTIDKGEGEDNPDEGDHGGEDKDGLDNFGGVVTEEDGVEVSKDWGEDEGKDGSNNHPGSITVVNWEWGVGFSKNILVGWEVDW